MCACAHRGGVDLSCCAPPPSPPPLGNVYLPAVLVSTFVAREHGARHIFVSGFRRAILTLRWRERAAVISSHLISLPPSSNRSFEVREELGEKENVSAERSMSLRRSTLRRSTSGGSSPPPLVIQLGPPRVLSAAEDAEYRTLFLSIDADGGGTIDPDEMLSAMHGAGRADVTAADVAALFAAIDEDGNGELDVDEFVEAMSRMEAPPSDDAANADSPSSQSSGSLGGALLSLFGKKNAAGQQPVDPLEAARIKALQAQVADTTRVLNEFYSVSGAGCGRRFAPGPLLLAVCSFFFSAAAAACCCCCPPRNAA